MDLRTPRKHDKITQSLTDLYGFGTYGRFACDKQTAKKLFDSRELNKPRWSVRALVLLREQGKCEICGENANAHSNNYLKDKSAYFHQCIPRKQNGTFTEPNVILLCRNCAKCLPVRTLFGIGAFSYCLEQLNIFILKRRQHEWKSVPMLSRNGNIKLKNLLRLQEGREVEAESLVKKLIKEQGEESVGTFLDQLKEGG